MTDAYGPFAIVAAISAAGAFVFGDPGMRTRIGLDQPAVEVTGYGVSGAAYRSGAASVVAEPMPTGATVVAGYMPRTLPENAMQAVVGRARQEVDRGVKYDATYRYLATYPNGDIPADRGACTDVVVRAFRSVNVDLQVLVHEDVVSDQEFYGFEADANVDHRRVGTLFSYFSRHTITLETKPKKDASSFLPGDVVFYAWKKCSPNPKYPCAPEHVALVSDRVGPRGFPMVLQNGGPRASEQDVLDHGTVVGHFRFPHDVPRAVAVSIPIPDLSPPPRVDGPTITAIAPPVAAPVPLKFAGH